MGLFLFVIVWGITLYFTLRILTPGATHGIPAPMPMLWALGLSLVVSYFLFGALLDALTTLWDMAKQPVAIGGGILLAVAVLAGAIWFARQSWLGGDHDSPSSW